MSKEKTCEYYYVGGSQYENDWLVKLLCRQLDAIDVTYTLQFKDHWCGLSPAATFIMFDEEQNRKWIEENVRFTYSPEINKYFKNVVDITTGSLIDCDNWLIKHYGLMEDRWTAEFGAQFNVYRFKDDADAMAFKLKFA